MENEKDGMAGVKAELIKHYQSKEPTGFLQFDGFANSDYGMPAGEPDADKDWCASGTTWELMSGGPNVRILITSGTTYGDTVRLIGKLLTAIQRGGSAGHLADMEELQALPNSGGRISWTSRAVLNTEPLEAAPTDMVQVLDRIETLEVDTTNQNLDVLERLEALERAAQVAEWKRRENAELGRLSWEMQNRATAAPAAATAAPTAGDNRKIILRLNQDDGKDGICGFCHEDCHPDGFDFFIEGTDNLVCMNCVRAKAPEWLWTIHDDAHEWKKRTGGAAWHNGIKEGKKKAGRIIWAAIEENPLDRVKRVCTTDLGVENVPF